MHAFNSSTSALTGYIEQANQPRRALKRTAKPKAQGSTPMTSIEDTDRTDDWFVPFTGERWGHSPFRHVLLWGPCLPSGSLMLALSINHTFSEQLLLILTALFLLVWYISLLLVAFRGRTAPQRLLWTRLAHWPRNRTPARHLLMTFMIGVYLPCWIGFLVFMTFLGLDIGGRANEPWTAFIGGGLAIIATLVPAGLVLLRSSRYRRRAEHTPCLACGHELLQPVGTPCPECGLEDPGSEPLDQVPPPGRSAHGHDQSLFPKKNKPPCEE